MSESWASHPDVRVMDPRAADPKWRPPVEPSPAVAGVKARSEQLLPGPMHVFWSRPTGTPVVLEIDPVVFEVIDRADADVNGGRAFERLEVGGYLLGDPARPEWIRGATHSSSEHTPSTCRLRDPSEVDACVLTIVGDWHSHTGGGGLKPSNVDLDGLFTAMLRSPRATWYSLIVSAGEFGGWDRRAYVTRPRAGQRMRPKTEPATVVLR